MSTNSEASLTLRVDSNDARFSWTLFVCRFFTGMVLIYMSLGSFLYWREFLINVAALGVPYEVPVAFGLCGAELLIGLFLLLGWHTRFFASVALLLGCVCTVAFFLGKINPMLIAWCLLLCAPLSVLIGLGAGVVSLDYKRSQRAAEKRLRG